MDVIYNAIDVSKHQGKINWEAVKNAGVTHAMLRAGYGRYKNQVDPQFERNSAECERLGIQYGVYWYSYASTPTEARQEARCCLAAIQGKHLCLPVAYDIEYEPCILRLTNAQRTALVEAFLGEVQDAGYYGILYASTDFIRNSPGLAGFGLLRLLARAVRFSLHLPPATWNVAVQQRQRAGRAGVWQPSGLQ